MIFSRKSVVLYVKLPVDLEEAVNKRKENYYEKRLFVQPFIIIVGPSIKKLDRFYIRCDTITYEIPIFLESLDVLFKLYLALNIEYPVASENICYLIQWSLFKIRHKSDRKIPRVLTLANKL